MKLPGIEYKQRGPLARVDPGSYVAIGQAHARAAQAVGETAGHIYEQQSVSEMQESYLNYSEQMDVWGDEQTSYTENEETGETEGSWISGPQKYQDQETELRDSINERITSPLARRLFNEKANQLNVQNKDAHRGQLQQWQKEHEVAGVYTRLNRLMDAKKFDDARNTVVEAYTVDTITESDAAAQTIKINYQEKYFNVSSKVDDLETPKEAIDYRETINASTLKESDKNKVIAAVDSKYLNSHRMLMNEVIIDAETVNGNKAEGYAAGEAYFEKIMRTNPEDLGGDDKFKEQILGTTATILARYKPEVIKQTSESTRYRNADDYNSGRRIAGTKFNVQMHDDSFAFNVLNFKPDGKADFNRDFDNPDPSQRGMEDPDILKNANGAIDKFVDYSSETGHMPKYVKNVLNAALTHNNAEYGAYATQAAYRLMQENPYALWRDGENNDLTQVATLSEMMGGGKESYGQAFSLWKQSQDLSKDQRTELLGSKKDRDAYFDDNFDSMLEKQYGDRDTAFFNFWTQTTPDVKEQYKVLARSMMDKYTVINKGVFERGLQSAIISMAGTYQPTVVNGGYTIMKNAPEVAVPDGNRNGGAWLPEQLKADVQKNYGEDVDMSKVSVEPVDKWNPNDPAYKVYMTDDTGMRRMLGITKFDYSLSGEYKEKQAELKAMEAANKRTEEMNKKRIQWDKEHPPEARKRGRTRSRTNPYGKAPGPGPIGKAVISYGKGTEAMRKGSESEIEARLRREEQARIEAAKPKKRSTRRGMR